MTTIVIDFKGKRVFSDKQATYTPRGVRFTGDNPDIRRYYQDTYKVFTLNDGVYLAGSGDLNAIHEQITYIQEHRFIGKPTGDMTIALVRAKGEGLFVDYYNTIKKWSWWKGYYYIWEHKTIQKSEGFLSFGSGGKYAAGAIQGGSTIERAMKVASELDEFTGCDIDVVEVL